MPQGKRNLFAMLYQMLMGCSHLNQYLVVIFFLIWVHFLWILFSIFGCMNKRIWAVISTMIDFLALLFEIFCSTIWAPSILQGWEYSIWCFTSCFVGFCWASACNSSPKVSGKVYVDHMVKTGKFLFKISFCTIIFPIKGIIGKSPCFFFPAKHIRGRLYFFVSLIFTFFRPSNLAV